MCQCRYLEHYLPLSFQYDCSLLGFDVSMEVFNVEHYLHLSFQYDCSLLGFDVYGGIQHRTLFTPQFSV